MKYIASLVLLVFFSKAQAEDKTQQFMEVLGKCREQTGAPEDVHDLMKTKKLPDSKEDTCLLECVMNSNGAMVNGKIDVDGSIQRLQKELADNPEKLNKMVHVMETCGRFDDSEMDRCEIAYTFSKCQMELEEM